MNKYGMAAIKAIQKINKHNDISPVEAWEQATYDIFGEGSAQKKGCPKATFLGICETGLVKGVEQGEYTNSKKNKAYAVKTLKYLQENRNVNINKKDIWNYVTGNNNISHNSQIDVVLALFQENLLEI
jgi:hypothetical protein